MKQLMSTLIFTLSTFLLWSQDLIIEHGDTLLISQDLTITGTLQISGVAQFTSDDVTLSCGDIYITGGKLICQDRRATIILGSDTRELVISDGGTLRLTHYQHHHSSWVSLDATAERGSNKLIVAGDISTYSHGDRLVLAGTDLEGLQTEYPVIQSIEGQQITLAEKLKHRHTSGQLVREGITLDHRAELSNLSYPIIVMAGDTSLGKGFHIMNMDGQIYCEGVLFKYGGRGPFAAHPDPEKRAAEKGRYALHWHHTGSAAGQYVKHSAFYWNFHTAISVHKTHDVVIEDVVVARVNSHGIMAGEHGDETGIKVTRSIVYDGRRLERLDFRCGWSGEFAQGTRDQRTTPFLEKLPGAGSARSEWLAAGITWFTTATDIDSCRVVSSPNYNGFLFEPWIGAADILFCPLDYYGTFRWNGSHSLGFGIPKKFHRKPSNWEELAVQDPLTDQQFKFRGNDYQRVLRDFDRYTYSAAGNFVFANEFHINKPWRVEDCFAWNCTLGGAWTQSKDQELINFVTAGCGYGANISQGVVRGGWDQFSTPNGLPRWSKTYGQEKITKDYGAINIHTSGGRTKRYHIYIQDRKFIGWDVVVLVDKINPKSGKPNGINLPGIIQGCTYEDCADLFRWEEGQGYILEVDRGEYWSVRDGVQPADSKVMVSLRSPDEVESVPDPWFTTFKVISHYSEMYRREFSALLDDGGTYTIDLPDPDNTVIRAWGLPGQSVVINGQVIVAEGIPPAEPEAEPDPIIPNTVERDFLDMLDLLLDQQSKNLQRATRNLQRAQKLRDFYLQSTDPTGTGHWITPPAKE